MGRLSFNTAGEPGTMMPLFEVLSDAIVWTHASHSIIPGGIQTEAYARAVLANWEPAALARQRAENRYGRAQILAEAGVQAKFFTSTAALGNLAAVGGDVRVLYDQLDHLAERVRTDMRTGERTVGFVHAGIGLQRYRDGVVTSNLTPRDASLVETSRGGFIIGPDGYEVDRVATAGIRSGLVAMRRTMLDEWQASAHYGADALDMIHQNQELLEAA